MNKCFLYAFAAVVCLSSIQTATCHADTLVAGTIAFNSGSPSFNTFDLMNLTGPNAGPPNAIADDELFSGTLNVTIGNLSTLYTFSNVDSSGNGTGVSNGGTIAYIPIGTDVVSAVLTLTLSKSLGVNIYDNSNPNTVIANLLTVPTITLSPLSGVALTPCDGSGSPCAAANITVDTAPATTTVTPEPETMWLVLTGVGGAAALRRRLRGL